MRLSDVNLSLRFSHHSITLQPDLFLCAAPIISRFGTLLNNLHTRDRANHAD